MKINHFSIFRHFMLLASVLATCYSLQAQTPIRMGDVEYLSGTVAILPEGKPDTYNRSTHGGIDGGWMFTTAAQSLQQDIIAYSASELGSRVRTISSFGFYITGFGSGTGWNVPYTKDVIILYRFTENNIYIPTTTLRYDNANRSGQFYTNKDIACVALGETGLRQAKPQTPSLGDNAWCQASATTNTKEWFIEQGFKVAHEGNVEWTREIYEQGNWKDFPLPEPHLYNGKENLHIVVLMANSNSVSMHVPMIAYYPLAHEGEDRNNGLADYPSNGYAHLPGDIIDENGFQPLLGYQEKPILRLLTANPVVKIAEVQPALVGSMTEYRQGTLLNTDESYAPAKRPAFTVDMGNITADDANLPNYIKYMIVGPTPYTDTVYRLVNGATEPPTSYITITKNEYNALADKSIEITQATGPMVWTEGEGADNRSLDLRNAKVGEYKAIVSLYTDKTPQTEQFRDTVWNNTALSTFYVRTNNDIEVQTPLLPAPGSIHSIYSSAGVKMAIPVTNTGSNDITEFWAQVYLRRLNGYNEATGSYTSVASVDTLPKLNPTTTTYYHYTAAQPLKTGDIILLNESDFNGGFTNLPIGHYDLEVKLWLHNPASSEPAEVEEPSNAVFNNVYPREGFHHFIHTQALFDPELTSHVNLVTPVLLGETVNINIGLQNNGLLDMSSTSGISLETTITNVATGVVVYRTTEVANRGGVGEGQVVIYCEDTWYANVAGTYRVVTNLVYPDAPTGWVSKRASITSTILVRDGLSGDYTIGTTVAGGRNYSTINLAIRDLYALGMTGNVTFTLTDAVYNEVPYIPSGSDNRWDVPALDFRSKIPGASEWIRQPNGTEVLRINTLRFVPSAARATEKGSIKINMTSRSGVGMWFGATNDVSVYPQAMVNKVVDNEKNKWYSNDGNITWDGGANQSFEFIYNTPLGSLDNMPAGRFRAPIYMINAKNITITNCIITDGSATQSGHYQLPGNTYIGPSLYSADDYDFANNVSSAQRTYSAGIIIHSTPLIQRQYSENRYNYATEPCYNITISNNDISRFAYGIVDIGLNYKMADAPFVIDVIDTVYGISQAELESNSNLEFLSTQAGVSFYRDNSITSDRYSRYYKLYNNYVVILDSAEGGARRAFNYNNSYFNNVIHNVGRAGIVLGNNENSVIAGNRIHGISGLLSNVNGAPASTDCAGIMLGGTPRQTVLSQAYDPFIVLGTKVYNNEISSVLSNTATFGIKLEQGTVREAISANPVSFPDRPERMQIYSNIVWGIMAGNVNTDRYGIALQNQKPAETTSSFAVANEEYHIDNILLANNTVLMDEDNFTGTRADYYGLYLQKIKNSQILNNAIEMMDSSQTYYHLQNQKAAAAVFYQGPAPAELNNTLNYNVYAFKTTATSDIAAYRYVSTDLTTGAVIDEGYSDEYKLLRNWQNWLHSEMMSNTQSFASELVKTQAVSDRFEKLRLRKDGNIFNSPLDKRGIYIANTVTDIDGNNRLVTNQTFDIGAEIVHGKRHAVDIEVVNIVAPATYQSMRGPFMDAEYFMIPDEPITVTVLVRNNGTSAVQNKKLSLRVLQESASINNQNAAIHTNNYTNLYYNNEARHNVSVSEFVPINSNAQITYYPLWDTVKSISIPQGQSIYVDFKLSRTFNTYMMLPNYSVPIQFSRMFPNVTPRYMFSASMEYDNSDSKQDNNLFEKYARFYIKKSKNDMLISASNTFNTVSYNNQPVATVSNPDMVAGRLNLDTLISGFSKLNLYQFYTEAPDSDFDVIDRKAWDFRNIDYTLYKTIYLSDELQIDTARWFGEAAYETTYRYYRDRWLVQNLLDFLNLSTSVDKRNLIVGSEEHVSDIYAAIQQNAFRFLQPNNTIKRNVADIFYRTTAIFDTLYYPASAPANCPDMPAELLSTLYGYTARSPIIKDNAWEQVTEPYLHWVYRYDRQPYLFAGKSSATITGVDLLQGKQIEIKTTGWQNSTLTDQPPFGTLLKPIENIGGHQRISAVADTITINGNPITGKTSEIPQNQRIMALSQNTLNSNIVFLGFDWRHFGNISELLIGLDDHLRNNGGYENGSPLPISFYGFEAVPVNNRVELVWNTASETVINHFELERANVINNTIGKYNRIESVAGKPNTKDNVYNATDRNLAFGSTLAYRLKLIDVYGNFTYSNEKIVTIEDAQFSISDIAPSPITAEATFNVTLPQSQQIHISIYDMAGSEVLVLHEGILNAGNSNFTISSAKLAAGAYTLSVRSNNQTVTRFFTVSK